MDDPHAGPLLHFVADGRGEPLIFLHDAGGSGADWAGQEGQFMKSFRVTLIDLRGHGGSRALPPPCTIDQHAEDVRALMDRTAMGAAHLVGLGLGGMVAWRLATQFPSRVLSLTLVNVCPAAELPATARLRHWARALQLALGGSAAIGAGLARRIFPQPDQSALRRAFIDRYKANPPSLLRASWAAMAGFQLADADAARWPILVLAADAAPESPLACQQSLAERLPGAWFRSVAGTHGWLPLGDPAAFNQALLTFLAVSSQQVFT
jgi:3-oxoadipate enol-lactonase